MGTKRTKAQLRTMDRVRYANAVRADGTLVGPLRGEHVSARSLVRAGMLRQKSELPYYLHDYELTDAGKEALATAQKEEERR